ncbi:hypothetical protein AVEN_134131-1, partial [Araneus ventricosus]
TAEVRKEEQSQTSTFRCSRHLVPTLAAHSLLLTMLGSPIISNTTSSVARVNKGRVRGLGRGPRTKRLLHSPNAPQRVKPLKKFSVISTGFVQVLQEQNLTKL